MPIETKLVLTCGQCAGTKAEANGWYLVFSSPKSITVRPAMDNEEVDRLTKNEQMAVDAACGRECAIKMVSKAMAELSHVKAAGLAHLASTPRRWRKGPGPRDTQPDPR